MSAIAVEGHGAVERRGAIFVGDGSGQATAVQHELLGQVWRLVVEL